MLKALLNLFLLNLLLFEVGRPCLQILVLLLKPALILLGLNPDGPLPSLLWFVKTAETIAPYAPIGDLSSKGSSGFDLDIFLGNVSTALIGLCRSIAVIIEELKNLRLLRSVRVISF